MDYNLETNLCREEEMKENCIKNISNSPAIVIIGGANLDITGFTRKKHLFHSSNPGKIDHSFGGVARNIAENLSNLGLKSKLISVFGDDPGSKDMIVNCQNKGIDISDSIFLKGCQGSKYLSVLDEEGELITAISDMDTLSKLNVSYLKSKKHIFNQSNYLICDTNPDIEVLELIAKVTDIEKFIDLVSVEKSMKVVDFIGNFSIVKANRTEIQQLTSLSANNISEIEKAAKILLEKGVKYVIITLGEDGVYYCSKESKGHIKAPKTRVQNVNGAGDAFFSGFIYGFISGENLEQCCQLGICCSSITISDSQTISNNINIKSIQKKLEDYFL